MADRQLIVRIIGDEKSLLNSFTRSSKAVKGFGADVSRASRGVAAGSGALSSLGRSLAFASGTFLGFAGVAATVRGAFDELNQSRQVTAQTNAVLRSTGLIAGVTAKHVDNLGQALLRKTGIDDEAIRSSENLLLTFTNVRNNVGKGNDIFDQATKATLDLSVAFGKDLGSSAILVGKALQDPVKGMTALRRVGVALSAAQEKQIKTFVRTGRIVSAQKVILRELTREVGGSAAAASKVQPWNLLRETLRNLSAEAIQVLLPKIIELTTRFQKWLDNTKNQQRVLADVKDAFNRTSTAIGELSRIVGTASKAVGGFKNLLVAIVLLKFRSRMLAFADSVTQIGNQSAIASTKVATLRSRLLGLGAIAIAPIVIPVVLDLDKRLRGKGVLGKIFSDLAIPSQAVGDLIDLARANARSVNAPGETGAEKPRAAGGAGSEAAVKAAHGAGVRAGQATAAAFSKGLKEGSKKGGITASQRNTFFDNQIARILLRSGLGTISQQIAGLQKADALIAARIKVTKDVTRRQNLEDQLLQNQAQIRSLQGEQVANKLQAKQDAREKALAALTSKQFRELGLNALGEERTPGVAGLKKRLQQLTANIAGTKLDTPKLQAQLARFRKVLSEGLVPKDVRAKINQLMGDIAAELQNQGKRQQTKFAHVNSSVVLAGLGLSPDQIRALRGRIAQIGAGGTVPGSRTPAFATAGGRGSMVTVPVYLDGKLLTQVVTNGQQKHGKRRSEARRGPYAGRH